VQLAVVLAAVLSDRPEMLRLAWRHFFSAFRFADDSLFVTPLDSRSVSAMKRPAAWRIGVSTVEAFLPP
jgi:hypothetical protein